MKKSFLTAAIAAAFLFATSAPAQFVAGNTVFNQNQNGRRNGPADGTGNKGQGPRDGTGYGAKSGKRSGPQDCTGAGRSSQGRGQMGGRGGRR
ncbi:MAG: hypothetical protein IT158_17715 [Bryobacterales bacterium]|nr:hypothetical protein [Bryobacterales bacterium]